MCLRVGLTAHFNDDLSYHDEPHLLLNNNYVRWVVDAGHEPVIIPTGLPPKDLLLFLRGVDAVLVSGGGPGITAASRKRSLSEQNPVRYAAEAFIIDYCLKHAIPLFGVCRGFQMIGELLGASLLRSLPSAADHLQSADPRLPSHEVRLFEGSLLHDVFGGVVGVNSLHTQGFLRLPEALVPVAVAPDGVVEAFASAPGFAPRVFGVQFHPEKMYVRDARFLRLLQLFLS